MGSETQISPKQELQKQPAQSLVQEITPDSKAEDTLLEKPEHHSPVSTPTTASPMKSTFSRVSIDEEKAQAQEQASPPTSSKNPKAQNILDIAQRCTSLVLSVVILGVMAHAYTTFLANKNVTAGGERIYPTFMQLWPTYMMITAAAITVLLNSCVVFWRIHGTAKDLKREQMYNKYWDYALHGINFAVWLATTTSFRVSKNWGPSADPNVLWGYTCSPTAKGLNAAYPEIIKFYVQCEVQTVSFWMSVSSIIVEGFAVAAKVFVR